MSQTLPLAFFSMPGGIEWIIIGLVALLLFGKRLPGVARALGQALHEFKSGLSGGSSEEKPEDKDGKDVTNAPVAKDAAPEAKKPDGE